MVGERYIGRYESDRKQGQTNSWGVDIVVDHDMPYLQYSNSSSASKVKDGSSCVAVLNVGKDIAEIEIPLAE